MIGLVLVTHGRLAEEMRSAMEHVVGPQKAVATVCIGPDDDMEGRRQEIRARIEEVEQGDGVVVLTDMFGGTPSNLASSMLSEKVQVLAGMNLPLLVKLAKVRGSERLAAAVEHAQAAGKRYMGTAADLCTAVAQAVANGTPVPAPGSPPRQAIDDCMARAQLLR
ncbi:PTS sugar transporter subunit IIA [Acetobacteraceae bacterium H6797]|nr:PTS sugar transporter subunit IIA [Acetobacteraceae bacterium H6797]